MCPVTAELYEQHKSSRELRHAPHAMRFTCASRVVVAWLKLTQRDSAMSKPGLVYRTEYTLWSFQLWRATRTSFD
jgi:hypothetical protein